MDWSYTSLTVERIWDVMENWVMVALPMFILMGLLLDRSGIANQLMHSFARLFGNLRGGLAITVTVIGLLLAATTGIIGASVVLLALLGLPAMLEQNYDKSLATGTVCAVGTLGILIPPSIMLVLMADRMSMSVGDLFLGAVFPGALLGSLYIGYLLLVGWLQPERAPAAPSEPIDWAAIKELFWAILPPGFLILAVLGSIFLGLATPTEAAGVGAGGALLLAIVKKQMSRTVMREVLQKTAYDGLHFRRAAWSHPISLVLRGLGDELIRAPCYLCLRAYRHHHRDSVRYVFGLLSRLDRAHPHRLTLGRPGGCQSRLRPCVVHHSVCRLLTDEFPDATGRLCNLLSQRGCAGRG